MTNVLRLAAFAVAFGVLTAPAFAGGGSSKSDPVLTIDNDSNAEVYVQVVTEGGEGGFQDDVIERLTDGLSTTFSDAFTDLGGVVINANGDADFEVEDGSYTILFANAAAVDAVNLGAVDAAAQIAALFNAGTIEVEEDVTVELSDL